MLQWMLLVVAVGGIASLARGRGGNPFLHGGLAAGAFVVGLVVAHSFGPDSIAQLLLPWIGVAGVALITRFVLGATRVKPSGKWVCPTCKLLNEASYVVCEACSAPFADS